MKSYAQAWLDYVAEQEGPEGPGQVAAETAQLIAKDVSARSIAPPTIIDLGCGDGALCQALSKTGFEMSDYIGIDVEPELLEAARRAAPLGRFLQADLSSDFTAWPMLKEGVPVLITAVRTFNNIDAHSCVQLLSALTRRFHGAWLFAIVPFAEAQTPRDSRAPIDWLEAAPKLISFSGGEALHYSRSAQAYAGAMRALGYVDIDTGTLNARRDVPGPSHLWIRAATTAG